MQNQPTTQDIWNWLSEVSDPEIPVLNVVELGIVREVSISNDIVHVVITPTYSGCPAMRTIEDDIVEVLEEFGVKNHEVTTVLSPAWTTDWMTDEAREKLRSEGISNKALKNVKDGKDDVNESSKKTKYDFIESDDD